AAESRGRAHGRRVRCCARDPGHAGGLAVHDYTDLVTYIIKAMVSKPDDVRVAMVEGERTNRVEVTLATEDVGKVIGRGGRGIDDRDAAQRLTGLYCTVPLADARTLAPDRYYHFQLVGLTVVDRRSARTIGQVAEVLVYDANDVLRVMDGDREVLIPMVRTVV